MPTSLQAFLAAKGFSHAVSVIGQWIPGAEKALVRAVVEAALPGQSCCRSMAHGGWVFTRAALDAWWRDHETEVVLVSLGA